MKYIYEISDGTHVYIGQSSAGGEPFSRVITHLNIAYGNETKGQDNPELLAMIRRHNLQDLSIKIYTEPYYGYNQKVFDMWFSFLTPYGHRVMPTTSLTSNTAVVFSKQTTDEKTVLDVAEILHIANALDQGKKVYNADFGGQYYGWSWLTNPTNLVLNKNYGPEEAKRVLDYLDRQLDQTQQYIDTAFDNWFNRTGNNSWHDFWNTKLTYSQKQLSKKNWKQFIYDAFIEWFWDTKTGKGAWLDLVQDLNKAIPTTANLNIQWRTPSQVQESLADVVSTSFANQIRSIKGTLNINNALSTIFSNHTFTSGKKMTLSFPQVISLKRMGLAASGWWKQPKNIKPAYNEKSPELKNRIINVSFNTMRNVYKSLGGKFDDSDFYTSAEIIPDTQYAFAFAKHPTLSTKIHEAFISRRKLTCPIVRSQWETYYGPMMSVVFNRNAASRWKSTKVDFYDKEVLIVYRNDTIEIDGQTYYVSHGVDDDTAWLSRDFSQIEVY